MEVALAAGRPSAIIQYYAADVQQLRSSAVQLVPAQTTSRNATLSYVVDGKDIERLPLSGRDLYSALALQPGVTSQNATGRGLGLSINGMPYTVSAARGPLGIINQRADIVDPAKTRVAGVAVDGGRLLLNPRAGEGFAVPAEGLGNSGRNAFLGPGLYNLDVSLARAFRPRWLGESGAITLRADAFNVLNHANLGQPDSLFNGCESVPGESPCSGFGQAAFGRAGSESKLPGVETSGGNRSAVSTDSEVAILNSYSGQWY